jgi:centromere-localized protein 2
MAPTEATILSTFLLPPAPLPSIITLKAFTELFPRAQQSSPQIKALYRDLQHQRSRLTDSITRNIGAEVKRGNAQRRVIVRARRAAEKEDQDDEVDVEETVRCQTLHKVQRSNSPTALRSNIQSTHFKTTHSRHNPARNGGCS